MLLTAREAEGRAGGAGVIGQAQSADLMEWTAEAPLFRVGYYGEMEVPQLFHLNGWWYCLFSNSFRHRDSDYLLRGTCGAATGTHYIRSRSPDGPFELVEERFFAGDRIGHFYGGRVVEQFDGTLVFMAFLNHDAHGSFVGQITDPMPIWTTPEGFLRIDGSKYGFAHADAGPSPTVPGLASMIHSLSTSMAFEAHAPEIVPVSMATDARPAASAGMPALKSP
jgi:beta-fructofuranosidase